MTDCLAPRHADEPVDAETHACLCGPCRRGLSRDLRRLPALYADLNDVLPGQQYRTHGRGTGDGLPFNDQASECRSQIRHDLTHWAMHITALRGWDAPPLHGDNWTTNPVPAMAGWLHGQVTWCTFRDWAGDMAGALADDAAKARSILDPWVVIRFTLPKEGICLALNADGVICGTRMEATIYASDGDRRPPSLDCPACGDRLDSTQWLAYGKKIIGRRTANHTPHLSPWTHGQQPPTSQDSTASPSEPSTGGHLTTNGAAS